MRANAPHKFSKIFGALQFDGAGSARAPRAVRCALAPNLPGVLKQIKWFAENGWTCSFCRRTLKFVKTIGFTICGLFVVLILCLCGIFALRLLFGRTHQFQAQAQLGKPIDRAIDEYRKQTGNYPLSLADLAPKFLPAVPDLPDESKQKFEGWDYRVVTNHTTVSFELRYYMGRGGIEYDPPNRIGNDEGHRTVILSNKQ